VTGPRIALDMGGLDGLSSGHGLFRYVVDLIRALAELAPAARFVVLGAYPEPIADIAPVFADRQWEYRHFPRSVGFAAAYRDQARMPIALAQAGVDLYHCLHTAVPLAAACPLVLTVHDMMFELFPEYAAALRTRPYRMFKWGLRRRARRVICPSRTSAADLARLWNVAPARIDVVPHGLRVFGAEPAGEPENEALRRLGSAVVVSSPLNLEPRKNLAMLLAAFAAIGPQLPEVRLVLFGKGGWMADREWTYRADLDRLGLADRVVETGVLSDMDLWHLYSRSDLFVFPTLYEGFGYPALEAMAAGTCPVVRACSSMAEVVGSAGVQVEPLTAKTLAGAIASLLVDAPRRRALATAARVRAETFTARRMAEGTFAAYEKALGKTGARP
jgi:glycosyltransferase involved in cell wall biosynthesis